MNKKAHYSYNCMTSLASHSKSCFTAAQRDKSNNKKDFCFRGKEDKGRMCAAIFCHFFSPFYLLSVFKNGAADKVKVKSALNFLFLSYLNDHQQGFS